MRVISGNYRGRKLNAPKGDDIRPTTDNVKESIFNIIQFDIEGRKVLDLFAGTGQLGIECLSRGAAKVVFTDKNKLSVNAVKENLAMCKSNAEVICTDALSYIENCGKFDIIFIDPPYDSGLYIPVLEKIYKFDILNVGGIIICESRKEENIPEPVNGYSIFRTRNYGRIKITIIKK